MKNMKDLETYKTSDIYLASFLYMLGKKLVNIDRTNAKRVNFVFLGDCLEEEDEFYMGEAKKFMDYARAMKDLKSILYNKLGGEDSDRFEGTPKKSNLEYKVQL